MTVIISSMIDPVDGSIVVERTSDRNMLNKEEYSSYSPTSQEHLNSRITQAVAVVQMYIYMILFHTPTQKNGRPVKKGGRSKTIIGVSRTPIYASDEYNKRLSVKDQATDSRWILVAMCGPFNDIETPEFMVEECKQGTKGAKSKINKLINLNEELIASTGLRSRVFVNRGKGKLSII